MPIESSEFEINEVVGCDSCQKASTERTMTFDEWNDLKSRSNMVRDFDNIGPCKTADDIIYDKFQKLCNPLNAVDPSHKPDYSCIVLSEECKVELWLLFVGLAIGFCGGLLIGVLL